VCLCTRTARTTTIADYHWDYDAFGRITFTSYDFSDGDDGSSTFSYDATGQLIEADHTAQADEEFEFDENGNRTMTGYDTGSNNLLLSDGVFDYVYDNEGNRISRTRISNDPADDKTVLYEWDYRNRLTRVVFKDNSDDVTKEVIYEYDVFNRRITKIIDADGEGVGVAEQTDFIYDGQDIVLALDGEGSLTNRYLHGPAIDQILADEQIAEEQLIWTLADNLGSVRDLVNNAGEVESHIDYTAFGAVETITNNLVQTLYGFTGRERDAETGLTYHRARYYDPLVGRWLSEDPIGFSAGDGNISRYVGNDPVNFVDPSGLASAMIADDDIGTVVLVTDPPDEDNWTRFLRGLTGRLAEQTRTTVGRIKDGDGSLVKGLADVADLNSINDPKGYAKILLTSPYLGGDEIPFLEFQAWARTIDTRGMTDDEREAAIRGGIERVKAGEFHSETPALDIAAGFIGRPDLASNPLGPAAHRGQTYREALDKASMARGALSRGGSRTSTSTGAKSTTSKSDDFERGPGGARKHTPGHRPEHVNQQAKRADAAKRASNQKSTDDKMQAVRDKWNGMSDEQRKLLKNKRGVDPDVTRPADLK
jgi:RHS repeat-associated protein